MTFLSIMLALAASSALLLGGYLFGARKGREARKALEEQLEEVSGAAHHLQREVRDDLNRLLNAVKAQEELGEYLKPMVERDRLSADLAQLKTTVKTRRGLSELLSIMADVGDFDTVLLSDDSGLLLASAGGNNRDLDSVAGISSLYLVISDRVKKIGEPIPNSFVVHDSTKQITLHRIIEAQDKRYLLSVVSKQSRISPEIFDASVLKVKELLSSLGM